MESIETQKKFVSIPKVIHTAKKKNCKASSMTLGIDVEPCNQTGIPIHKLFISDTRVKTWNMKQGRG